MKFKTNFLKMNRIPLQKKNGLLLQVEKGTLLQEDFATK